MCIRDSARSVAARAAAQALDLAAVPFLLDATAEIFLLASGEGQLALALDPLLLERRKRSVAFLCDLPYLLQVLLQLRQLVVDRRSIDGWIVPHGGRPKTL